MSDTIVKVVARLGNAADTPLLINGEIAYDVDTKTFRVGDDTADASKIPTSKSTGLIEFLEELTVKFGVIELHPDGTVDGVNLKTFNESTGIVVRTAEDGIFANRQIVTEIYDADENGEGGYTFLDIENPDGANGDIKISVTQALLDSIGANGGIKLHRSESAPPIANVKLGDFWLDTVTTILYIRLGITDNANEHWWMDISSASGGSGIKYYSSEIPPGSPALGDEWFDEETSKHYKRTDNGGQHIWLEMRV